MLVSRKWKAVLIDAVFSSLILIVSFWVGDPKLQDFILKFIAIYQPVFIAYIAGVAYEDAAINRSPVFPPSEKAEKGEGNQ